MQNKGIEREKGRCGETHIIADKKIEKSVSIIVTMAWAYIGTGGGSGTRDGKNTTQHIFKCLHIYNKNFVKDFLFFLNHWSKYTSSLNNRLRYTEVFRKKTENELFTFF